MKKVINLIAVAVLTLTSTSCKDDGPDGGNSSPFRPIDLPAETRSAITAGNDFSLSLFRTLPADANTVLSPYSVFSTLSMLADADTGDARDEILEKFGFSEAETGIVALNSYCGTLNSALSSLDSRVSLNISNSIWSVSSPTASFMASLTENYKGEWISKSPAGLAGMNEVNKYVAKKTDNMIPEFLKNAIDSDVMLLNTVCFNGRWTKEFDSDLTKPTKFKNIDGESVLVPFMMAELTFDVYEDDKVTAVEIPYGSGNFAMTLLMPSDGNSFVDLHSNISATLIQEVYSGMSKVMCSVSLPKFKTDAKFDLSENLQKMGFVKLFDSNYADLIEGGAVRMNQILHAAAIEVDEKGTKASAAISSGLDTSVGPGSIVRFDTPFIYVIRETSTNTILFVGQITNF